MYGYFISYVYSEEGFSFADIFGSTSKNVFGNAFVNYEYELKDFEISDFNVNTKGLYECLEEYVKANFYLDDNGNMSFRGHDLYETIGGVRI